MPSFQDMMGELRRIAESAEHVSFDRDQLERVASVMGRRLSRNEFKGRRDVPSLSPEDLLHYYMIAGSQNFLFWEHDESGKIIPWHVHVNGELRYGAPASYACHARAIAEGRNILDPDYLASMTLADMEYHYRDDVTGQTTIKLVPGRLAKFNEIGRVLKEKYNGSFITLMERSEGYMFRDDGQGIAQRLAEDFPLSYGDWPFIKLVMVTMGTLWARRDTYFPAGSYARQLMELRDPETIMVGADYYRPFYLYRVGILKISEAFEQRLAAGDLFEPGGQMEREYRAWTILAACELAERLGVIPHDVADETWGMGFMRCRPCYIGVPEDEVPCDYRSFCYSYNEAPSLMQVFWPQVLTTNY